ncbi:hypothetical protein Emag_004146 [Eimeria magna]
MAHPSVSSSDHYSPASLTRRQQRQCQRHSGGRDVSLSGRCRSSRSSSIQRSDSGSGEALELTWTWTSEEPEEAAAAASARATTLSAAAAAADAAAAGVGAEAAATEATATAASLTILPVLESLLHFVSLHAADGHSRYLDSWGPLLWETIRKPLVQLLLPPPQQLLALKPEQAAAAARQSGAVPPFAVSAAAAAGVIRIEQLLVQQGLLQQGLLQQQRPRCSSSAHEAKLWLVEVFKDLSVRLLAAARRLLQNVGAATPVTRETIAAADSTIPGGLRDLLLPQDLSQQQQQQQQRDRGEQQRQVLQLLQCVAEEADVSLVQLAPLRITRSTWLLLQQMHSLLKAAAAAAAGCSCNNSSGVSDCTLPCWCSSSKGRPGGCCTSSRCCSSRIAARAQVAAAVSVGELFLLLRPLIPVSSACAAAQLGGEEAAAADAAAPDAAAPAELPALALRWTDMEVICRWLLRLPLMLATSAAALAARAAPVPGACSCSGSTSSRSSSSSNCCNCPRAAAWRAQLVLNDSLPLFDSGETAPSSKTLSAAAATRAAITATGATAAAQQHAVPFRQQVAEIAVALKQQQEAVYFCMVGKLREELQGAAVEVEEALVAAARNSSSSSSSGSLEVHMETAAGALTQKLQRAALSLLPILPLQVYVETVGLASDCLIDCVLRAILAAALAAAAAGVFADPTAAAAAAGNSSSRATAQRLGPLCCSLLQHVRCQLESILLLNVSRHRQRPEAATASAAAEDKELLRRLLAPEGLSASGFVDAHQQQQQQQQQQPKQQEQQQEEAAGGALHGTAEGAGTLAARAARAEVFCRLLPVAVALQQVLEADALLLLQQIAGPHAAMLGTAFPESSQRLALVSLNPFLGAAPLAARQDVFAAFAASAHGASADASASN